ncbi:MAG: hypothetical protein OEW69_12090 [Nitrospirota bacterium]|nr:hypothetical protein [Nitrospirota bacterium]
MACHNSRGKTAEVFGIGHKTLSSKLSGAPVKVLRLTTQCGKVDRKEALEKGRVAVHEIGWGDFR